MWPPGQELCTAHRYPICRSISGCLLRRPLMQRTRTESSSESPPGFPPLRAIAKIPREHTGTVRSDFPGCSPTARASHPAPHSCSCPGWPRWRSTQPLLRYFFRMLQLWYFFLSSTSGGGTDGLTPQTIHFCQNPPALPSEVWVWSVTHVTLQK